MPEILLAIPVNLNCVEIRALLGTCHHFQGLLLVFTLKGLMALAVYLGLLSCCRINLGPVRSLPDGIAWWINICLYFSANRIWIGSVNITSVLALRCFFILLYTATYNEADCTELHFQYLGGNHQGLMWHHGRPHHKHILTLCLVFAKFMTVYFSMLSSLKHFYRWCSLPHLDNPFMVMKRQENTMMCTSKGAKENVFELGGRLLPPKDKLHG